MVARLVLEKNVVFVRLNILRFLCGCAEIFAGSGFCLIACELPARMRSVLSENDSCRDDGRCVFRTVSPCVLAS